MSQPIKKIRFLLASVILVSFVGCDQATKRIATETLQHSPPRSYLGDTVQLSYALNPGGFLSLGASLSPETRFWVFVGFNAVVLVTALAFLVLRWNTQLTVFVALAFVVAGGIGNLIDRVSQNGLVTDFLVVGLGPVRTGIFNIADMGVLFGAMTLILSTMIPSSSQRRPSTSDRNE